MNAWLYLTLVDVVALLCTVYLLEKQHPWYWPALFLLLAFTTTVTTSKK